MKYFRERAFINVIAHLIYSFERILLCKRNIQLIQINYDYKFRRYFGLFNEIK